MVPQGSNTGAGSPPRPASATMQHPGVAMARNASHQAPGSRNHTPQMANTPSMAQAMPGRQPSQTPRMQPGSPAVGMAQNTPNNLMMQNAGQMNSNMTPEQAAMLQAQRAALSHGQGQAGDVSHMTPQAIQIAQQIARCNQLRMQTNQSYAHFQSIGDTQRAQQERSRMVMLTNNLKALQQRQVMVSNAGSPGVGMQQQNSQMGHAHPGQQQSQQQQGQQGQMQGNMQDPNMSVAQQQALAQQQFAAQQRNGHAQLSALLQRYQGNIPAQVVESLPPPLKQLLHQQQMKQQAARAQAQARMQQQNQQQQQGGGGMGNEQYVQNLQRMQNQLGMQMNQPQQQQPMNNGMGMMGMNNMQQFGGQQQQQGQGQDPLNAHFGAMQNALQRGQQGMQ